LVRPDPYLFRQDRRRRIEYSLAFDKGKETASRLRELLQAMGLVPLVKTSGRPTCMSSCRSSARSTSPRARGLGRPPSARQHPSLITMDWSIQAPGRIFFDYTMNTRGKTLAAAYSPRGLPGAPVSIPLTWEELETAQPLDFTLAHVAARLAQNGDPWRDALIRKHSLERTLARAKA
jgi:bifunctional non-homologous end joining protein LigD